MYTLEIMTAEEKRKDLEIRRLQKELDEAIYQARKTERVINIIKEIYPTIKQRIEKAEYSCVDILYTTNTINKYNRTDFLDAIKVISDFLINAGYDVHDFHEYSKSWQTRSGRFGYLYIHIK